jgi:hypothetical protein
MPFRVREYDAVLAIRKRAALKDQVHRG